jgi:hypothetical protein
MKAYGLRDKFRYNYTDCHPKKGWVNWWEAELNTVKSKKTARQKIKRELKKLNLL